MSRYIAASTFSHFLLICLLWIAYSNVKTAAPVFNVNIVGPLETDKPHMLKIPQSRVIERKPLQKQLRQPPSDKKLLPQTLYDEGRGDYTSLAPLNRGEENPLSEKDKPALSPPSALFDKNIIENYAKKESPADRGLTFEMPDFKNRGYMRMLKEKIESIWRYPKEAARLGISGDLYLKFSIKKDGKLGEVELLRTSGYKDFDEAAMKALKEAEPFWPLPEDWEKDDLEITGHFIYIYGDAVVM
ncbi:MAG: energy transducer TonB [Nitrospirae bacterium]|nr:energy transducer TonB [Nitrospirota bacterium]